MGAITKERLKNYIYIKRENDNKLEQLARLRSQEHFPGLRESDVSKHQIASGNRVETAVIRRMEYQEKIADRIEENHREMETIERTIECLSDPMERAVLELRYIDCENYRHRKWTEVAMMIYHDDDESKVRMVHYIHGRALQSIRDIKHTSG